MRLLEDPTRRQDPDRACGPSNAGKTEGIMPGMRVLDPDGVRYFVKFDSPGYRELATGAEVVATKLFHALGYHVPENYIAYIDREDLVIGEGARQDFDDGRRLPLTERDLDIILSGAAQETRRVLQGHGEQGASREHPSEGFGSTAPVQTIPTTWSRMRLVESWRGLRVFSAWLNHVDCKGGNTLDTIIEGTTGAVIRHHLIDFGSTLGSAGIMPREAWEGSEYIFDGPDAARRMFNFGLPTRRWMHARYPDLDAVGRFEADAFAPDTWKPRLPNAAFERARPEDLFWAAPAGCRLHG